MSDTHWPDYYRVTAERPAWGTVTRAVEAFLDLPAGSPPRLAVDLGCGAGRDTRELLRRGWRVIAVDRTPEGIETLRALTPEQDRERLELHVADVADFAIPPCDLVNANLILPFLPRPRTRRRGSASGTRSALAAGSAACSSATETRRPARSRT